MAFLPFKRQFFCFQAVRYAASENDFMLNAVYIKPLSIFTAKFNINYVLAELN